jgi:hypothetical protein
MNTNVAIGAAPPPQRELRSPPPPQELQLPLQELQQQLPVGESDAPLPLPTPAVLKWTQQELTAIGHFLPMCGRGDPQNASDWKACGCGQCCEPSEMFDPRGVDTDSWVSALAAFGAKTAVFVLQHSCGFSQWPTKAAVPEANFVYNYSVA